MCTLDCPYCVLHWAITMAFFLFHSEILLLLGHICPFVHNRIFPIISVPYIILITENVFQVFQSRKQQPSSESINITQVGQSRVEYLLFSPTALIPTVEQKMNKQTA